MMPFLESHQGWTLLLQISAKVSLLFLAGMALTQWGRGSAAFRHWVWCTVTAGALLLPLLTLVLPVWSWSVLPSGREAVSVQRTLPPESPALLAPASISPVLPSPVLASQATTQSSPPFPWPSFMLWLWAAGFCFHGLRFAREAFWLRSKRRRAEVVSPRDACRQLATRCAHEMNLKRTPCLLRGEPYDPPMTWGLFRPIILLPSEAWQEWPVERRRWVLLHECAHIKRCDYFFNILSHFAVALYWFHPLAWWANRRLAAESERACDDLVLAGGAQAVDYAEALVKIAGARVDYDPFARLSTGMAHPRGIQERLRAMLDERLPRGSLGRRMAGAICLLMILILLPFAALRLSQRPLPDSSALNKLITDALGHVPISKKKALWSLGEREDVRAVTALVRTARDEDPEVRGLSIWALGEIKAPASLPTLIQALGDEDPLVREMAARSVGELEMLDGAAPLLTLSGDPNPGVRAATIWGLGEISARARLLYPENARLEDVRLTLLNAMQDEDPLVRKAAVEALARVAGKRPDADAIPNLGAALEDPDPAVRVSAARLLGSLGSAAAGSLLEAALHDEAGAVRIAAAKALGQLGLPASVEPLLGVLRDPDPKLREMAVWALDEIGH